MLKPKTPLANENRTDYAMIKYCLAKKKKNNLLVPNIHLSQTIVPLRDFSTAFVIKKDAATKLAKRFRGSEYL